MVSDQNLNSSKLSCMSLSRERIKMIQSKMKGLEWSQHFPHYKSMEIFPDAQGQLMLRLHLLQPSYDLFVYNFPYGFKAS